MPIFLTFKRKQIIRDQNWFRVECELSQDNLFKEEDFNAPSLCRGGFYESHTFTFLTYDFHTLKNIA